MGDKTGIEWTDATWNPLRGCTRVSEGCRNCYAEGVAARFSGPGQPYEGLAAFVGAERLPRWTGKVALAEHLLDQPLRWKKPRRIFVNSMSDLFHESVPDEWIDRIFAVMALAPQHTFQVLTKRPARMRDYCTSANTLGRLDPAIMSRRTDNLAIGPLPHLDAGERWWPLANVWLGVSVEDQATADERIPLLLETPAAKRFISAEPLLGPVRLDRVAFDESHYEDWLRGEAWDDENGGLNQEIYGADIGPKLDWVIVGGESGPKARPMHPDWVRSLRDQCAAAGVPFFFKQWGEWEPATEERGHVDGSMERNGASWVHRDGLINGPSWHRSDGRKDTNPFAMIRVGKKAAGHLLDGCEHREFPA